MVEVSEERRAEVIEAYRTVGVEAIDIGKVTDDGQVCSRFTSATVRWAFFLGGDCFCDVLGFWCFDHSWGLF